MAESPTSSTTYRDAGVDIEAGDALVDRIKPAVKRSMRREVLGGIGGFGALVEVPLDRYRKPVMVSGTDGVGTKLRLAIETGRHDTIGIDLVAMCVNDVVVQGHVRLGGPGAGQQQARRTVRRKQPNHGLARELARRTRGCDVGAVVGHAM